ncbi:MAG: 3-methyl-2-oxobutanoate dehydrogenase subunit VorB [Ruminococcus sp.]|nr:3-methyl-2-oxobutanoate dehydrogenase subunit VorB [Ruminococcus sp.]
METYLMKGNEALAEAAMRAGCKCFFGYPITPQTELAAYMAKQMPKRGGVFLQAESELAAVNMLLGAASTGVRAMTSSSSPGISLKTEGISYMAGCDLPAVIINVQRGGPGLGSIQPSQADYFQATRAMGHGDAYIIVLAPDSVQEMADFVALAFELADKYRIPALVLADGLLGQMMEPVSFAEPTQSSVDKSEWAANGHKFKREHNIVNSLYLDAPTLEKIVKKRYEKYKVIEENERRCECYMCEDAEILVTAYGAAARIAKTAVAKARQEGIKAGLFRPITLYPFPRQELRESAKSARVILDTELSMGQMVEDVQLSLGCTLPVEFYGRTGGVVPAPEEILLKLREMNGGKE